MYEYILDKMLIFKKVTSDVIRCHQMSGKVLQNKEEIQGRQEKRVGAGEGTYRREKDKRRAWHGRKKERVRRPMQNRGS